VPQERESHGNARPTASRSGPRHRRRTVRPDRACLRPTLNAVPPLLGERVGVRASQVHFHLQKRAARSLSPCAPGEGIARERRTIRLAFWTATSARDCPARPRQPPARAECRPPSPGGEAWGEGEPGSLPSPEASCTIALTLSPGERLRRKGISRVAPLNCRSRGNEALILLWLKSLSLLTSAPTDGRFVGRESHGNAGRSASHPGPPPQPFAGTPSDSLGGGPGFCLGPSKRSTATDLGTAPVPKLRPARHTRAAIQV
jgi:hypothetical protein